MKTSNLLLVSPWSYTEKSVKFYLAGEVVEYGGVTSELANSIAEICNGEKDLNGALDELSKLNWNRSDSEKLLKSMIEQGLIVDSTYVHPYVRKFTDNPTPFSPMISEKEIGKLMAAGKKPGRGYKKYPTEGGVIKTMASSRVSTREFGKSGISKRNLLKILWSLYGKYGTGRDETKLSFRRTVPSGGALYPLNFYLILIRNCGDIKRGLYEVRIEEDSIGLKPKKGVLKNSPKGFIDPYMLKNAQGVIVVSADMERVARKYGNRTAKYCYLEAGHSVQNMFLQSSHTAVATCELGGFREEDIEDLLDIKGQEAITAVVFGSFPKENHPKKESIDVNWKNGSDYGIPTEVALGNLSSKRNRGSSSGKDKDILVALDKLASEVIEWNSWNSLPVISGKIDWFEPKRVIHPHKILDYGKRDLDKRGIFPFDEDYRYEWIKGRFFETDQEIHILADLVSFPYESKRPYAFANSSGCAAHPDRGKAIDYALFELVERDAFMIWWLNRLEAPSIMKESLPEEHRERIKAIEKLGYEVVVKDITLDLAPVLMIASRRNDEIFVCSQSSGEDWFRCLDKALGEMETAIISHEADPGSKIIEVENVRHPRDHGDLYKIPEFVKETDFVFSTGKKVGFKSFVGPVDIKKRLKEKGFDIIIIDATSCQPIIRNVEKRWVVRAVVPGLVPITFGYNMEPLGMRRVTEIPELLNLKKTKEVKKLIPHPLD